MVAAARPPMTARPSGAAARAFADRERHRHHAGDHRGARHQHGPHARPGGGDRRLLVARLAACSANVTSRIAFATATPIAMMAPMNDCTLTVVRVASSISTTPASTAGTVEMTTNASRSDWKFAASSRKMTTTATSSPTAMFLKRVAHRRDLAANGDARAARQRARPGDGLVDARGDAPEVLARGVGRQRHHPLAVEAIVFADDRAVLDARDVAEQRMRRAVGADGHDAQVVERRHARLRHFDLHLERDARPRIGPVVRRDEPARRGRGGKRSPDLIDGDAQLPGTLPIDVDVDGRILERLLELQVPQRRDLRELVVHLRRERARSRRSPVP